MVGIKFWVKCSGLLQLHSHIELVYKIGFVVSKRRPTKSVGCSKSLGDQKVQELIYMYNWSFFYHADRCDYNCSHFDNTCVFIRKHFTRGESSAGILIMFSFTIKLEAISKCNLAHEFQKTILHPLLSCSWKLQNAETNFITKYFRIT